MDNKSNYREKGIKLKSSNKNILRENANGFFSDILILPSKLLFTSDMRKISMRDDSCMIRRVPFFGGAPIESRATDSDICELWEIAGHSFRRSTLVLSHSLCNHCCRCLSTPVEQSPVLSHQLHCKISYWQIRTTPSSSSVK